MNQARTPNEASHEETAKQHFRQREFKTNWSRAHVAVMIICAAIGVVWKSTISIIVLFLLTEAVLYVISLLGRMMAENSVSEVRVYENHIAADFKNDTHYFYADKPLTIDTLRWIDGNYNMFRLKQGSSRLYFTDRIERLDELRKSVKQMWPDIDIT